MEGKMKKFLLTVVLGLLLSPVLSKNIEEVAKELLTAYRNRNIAGVKEHMAAMLASAVDAKFFEEKDVKEFVESLKTWDGKIREVRYFSEKIGLFAAVYYDETGEKEKIRVIYLNKYKDVWKQALGGPKIIAKEEFLTYGKTEDSAGKTVKGDPDASNKGFSFENAEGRTGKDISVNTLKKELKALSDDNFFLTLNGPEGFIQASYSEKGLEVQYKDAGGQFTSSSLLDATAAESVFVSYILKESGWKEKCGWKPFE